MHKFTGKEQKIFTNLRKLRFRSSTYMKRCSFQLVSEFCRLAYTCDFSHFGETQHLLSVYSVVLPLKTHEKIDTYDKMLTWQQEKKPKPATKYWPISADCARNDYFLILLSENKWYSAENNSTYNHETAKVLRQNPTENLAISGFSGQKSGTRTISSILQSIYILLKLNA